ncbi:uncharacterized protein CELE_C33D9.13 [Caenorhabditis elegans]|uniref:Uncharacterized protein n=1 Tax=Caenorhabditis elegans TaxID=6239 RepID=C6KRJ1_CAEEL|nr:Uncharacterized protein CELE_C33D9.13 [Caenorhabditis elegans]CAZ65475.1 Uncharacterized protein CELE_C33D9.13 [Caenorhabditis elegans]|eukprot:NP_001255331.1 Uncharacterized protein CELE_C33D9.13 [Caenorhabditis elegans]
MDPSSTMNEELTELRSQMNLIIEYNEKQETVWQVKLSEASAQLNEKDLVIEKITRKIELLQENNVKKDQRIYELEQCFESEDYCKILQKDTKELEEELKKYKDLVEKKKKEIFALGDAVSEKEASDRKMEKMKKSLDEAKFSENEHLRIIISDLLDQKDEWQPRNTQITQVTQLNPKLIFGESEQTLIEKVKNNSKAVASLNAQLKNELSYTKAVHKRILKDKEQCIEELENRIMKLETLKETETFEEKREINKSATNELTDMEISKFSKIIATGKNARKWNEMKVQFERIDNIVNGLEARYQSMSEKVNEEISDETIARLSSLIEEKETQAHNLSMTLQALKDIGIEPEENIQDEGKNDNVVAEKVLSSSDSTDSQGWEKVNEGSDF